MGRRLMLQLNRQSYPASCQAAGRFRNPAYRVLPNRWNIVTHLSVCVARITGSIVEKPLWGDDRRAVAQGSHLRHAT